MALPMSSGKSFSTCRPGAKKIGTILISFTPARHEALDGRLQRRLGQLEKADLHRHIGLLAPPLRHECA